MLWIKRSLALLISFSVAVAALWSPLRDARAQGLNPSADQIEMFRGLSPDLQQQLIQQFAGSGSDMSANGMGDTNPMTIGAGSRQGQGSLGLSGTGSSLQDLLRNPSAQCDDTTGDDDSEQCNQREPLIPVLKAQDWVVIEIDFHLAPRPSRSSQGFAAGLQIPGQAASAAAASPQAIQALQGSLGPATAAQALAAQQAVTGSNSQVPTNTGAGTGNGDVTAALQGDATSGDNSGLSVEEKARLQDLVDLVRSKDPYQLSRTGELTLPGFFPIPLLGLNEDQATLRLKVEPAFKDLDIRVTRLPVKKTGVAALKPFGYDLFNHSPSTFAPVTNVPVPSDYLIGPGDELDIQLYGSQNRYYRTYVGRDGRISLPEIGPISVVGQPFNTMKQAIEERVERQMIGTRASVSMGETRSIRVFVLGEARRPGSYTISGLGTITSALFAAGGVKTVGSLRRIELKRQGQLVRQLDLYDMLIRGDTTDDTKLLQGDVVFIPSVGHTVSIDGEIKRPAIYEIKNESTVADVVQLAGGLTPQADTGKAMLTRIDDQLQRIVIPVDLTRGGDKTERVRNGDLIRISRLRPTLDAGIQVQGHVYVSAAFAYRPGMHLTDVIRSVDDLRPNADIHYVLIRRELPPDRHIAVLSADLGLAWRAPGSKSDPVLMPRDQVTVFDLASGREHVIRPVLDELRLQADSQDPTEVVRVDGRVRVPGEYPLESGMTVADLVRAGGGLSDAAYGGQAELTRYSVVDGETRRTKLIDIDLAAALRNDPESNLKLAPFDNLSIKEVSQWHARESIVLTGEVRFPGRYAIKAGESLRSVVARAGGLTEFAFAEGAVFTRVELKRREQQQLDMLAARMQTDLTALALEGAAANQGNSANALQVGQALLAQLHATKAIGRLVIDLPESMHAQPGSPQDIMLRDGDQLIVPKYQQQVTVIGEVQSATSHVFAPGLDRNDYITASGGTTKRADRGRIYVVRANGNVYSNEGSRWFQRGDVPIHPGDTIVVPLDMERYPPLPFWQAVTQIIYNVAIAAAAVHSFSY